MDEEAVQGYVRRAQSIVDASPDMDEANTKASLIRPLVELLGWSVQPSEVLLDHTVEIGAGTGIVDYALLLDGEHAIYVIASGSETEITDDTVGQFREFLPELPVDRVVLTNGVTYEVLVDRDGGEPARIGFDIDDLADRPSLLQIVAKEAIENGTADEVLREVTGPEPADLLEDLQENKVSIARRVSDAVKAEVDSTRGLDLAARSGEFVERLIDTLETQQQRERREQAAANGAGAMEWTPEPGADAVAGSIKRNRIDGSNNATVAVFAVREPGMEFVREHNAWGAIHLDTSPDFVALYVRGEVREVRYVATVQEVCPPDRLELAREAEVYEPDVDLEEWEQVCRFVPETLYELEDPIPYESRYPLGTQVTTLKTFRSADTTDDLF